MGKFGMKKKQNKSENQNPDEELETKLSENSVISGKITKKKHKKSKHLTAGDGIVDKVKDSIQDLGKEEHSKKNKTKVKKNKKTKNEQPKITPNGETPENATKPSDGIENQNTVLKSKPTKQKNKDGEKELRHDSKPENTVFIGNLPNNTKKSGLNTLLKEFGKIVSIRFRTADGKKLFKHATRKQAESLNAYVVFDNSDSVQKALSLAGTEFKGRHIRVTSLNEYAGETKATVFVGNLKYSATDEKLYDVFSTCGELNYVRTVRNEKGCTGVAYVCFKKPESVSLALELNETIVDERPIRVQPYRKNIQAAKGSKKAVSGPVRRMLEQKKLKQTNGSSMSKSDKVNRKSKHKGESNAEKPEKLKKSEKKSDYRGMKMSANKKTSKKPKMSHLQKLAKKIAPK